MNTKSGEWLRQKLAQNGFTLQDLADQSGLSLDEITALAKDQTGTSPEWDLVMGILNDYPVLYYPSSQVIDDLENLVSQEMSDEMVRVYFGVNQTQLIFCGFENPADNSWHGSNVSTQFLKSMLISVSDALSLFEAQNFEVTNAG